MTGPKDSGTRERSRVVDLKKKEDRGALVVFTIVVGSTYVSKVSIRVF